MGGDIESVSLAMESVYRARDELRDFAAHIWAVGTRRYSLRGRTSLHRASLIGPGESEILIGESIELDEVRSLELVIEIFFGPKALAISGSVVVTRDNMPDGFDESVILSLPKRQAESIAAFISILDNCVASIIADGDLLDRIAEG